VLKSFTNQVAVVTGGTSGVGRAIAEALTAGGAQVLAVGRATVDLTDDAAIARFAATQTRVDILVHSAGVFTGEAVAQVNARAPELLTRALLPLLKQVVFINSSVALRSDAGPYADSKRALKAFADRLRDEVNPAGVRVLSVYLGRTATPMQARIYEQERRPYEPERLLQPADVAAVVVNALQLPRTAEVTEISVRPLQKP